MACGGCQGSDELFADARLLKCKGCQFADWETDGGICLPTAEKHGIGKASIEDGIVRPELACPKNEWAAVQATCPRCTRPRQMLSAKHRVCQWCVIKYKLDDSQNRKHFVASKKKNVGRVADPFAGEPIVNLHYFIYPRYEDSTRYHLEQIRKYRHLINGRAVVCVATDANTVHKAVENELESLFDVVYYRANDPKRRELVGFIETLQYFERVTRDEVIVFAHAKGQQDWTHGANIIRDWCDAMYETTLGNLDAIKDALASGYALAGPFKNIGMFKSTAYRWHYSGTFFAARAHRIFSLRDWRTTCRHFWGSESWVGRHFHADEAACLFSDNTPNGALYKPEHWAARVTQELADWRASCVLN
jgi:hypothetical protein